MMIKITLLLLLFLLVPCGAVEYQVPPPKVTANAYFLQDFDTGFVMAERDADKPLEPASLTKIMTAYVVFHELAKENISLNQSTLISHNAQKKSKYGSRMFLRSGTRVSVLDLLKGLIIQSGNDAAIALAELIAGSEETFAEMMNQHAQILKMKNTHFSNSSGLPARDHYTSARDLAILSRAMINEFPKLYAIFAEKSFKFNNIKQPNRNILLTQDSSVDGLKTGYTRAAGYCLVASSKRKKMRLISVIIGAKSKRTRFNSSRALLNYGFRFYSTYHLYPAKKELYRYRIWLGDKEKVSLAIINPVIITIPRGNFKDLSASMAIDTQLSAPMEAGRMVGKLSVMLGKKALAERDLVVLKDINSGPFWVRLRDKILMSLEK